METGRILGELLLFPEKAIQYQSYIRYFSIINGIYILTKLPYQLSFNSQSVLDGINSSYIKYNKVVDFTIEANPKLLELMDVFLRFATPVQGNISKYIEVTYNNVTSCIPYEYYLNIAKVAPGGFPLKVAGNDFYKFAHLSGAVSFIQMRKGDKEYLLIGDRHIGQREYSCEECFTDECSSFLPRFLDTVITATKGKVDLFMEEHYHKEMVTRKRLIPEGENIGTIGETTKYFLRCIKANKTECQERWPNLRFHYSDIRDFLMPDRAKFTRIAYGTDDYIAKNLNIQLNKLAPFLTDPDGTFFLVHSKIIKQLNRIDPIIKNELIRIYTISWRQHYTHFIENYQSYERRKDVFSLRILITNYIKLFANVMDIYMWARSFKQFPEGEPKNIIVYAGNAHIERMKLVLENLGFSVIGTSSAEGGKSMCLSLPPVQPFFLKYSDIE